MQVAAALFTLALAFLPSAAWGQAAPAEEYAVKAAFLLSFAKFVDWPEDSQVADSALVRLCVQGDDPFGPSLDGLAANAIINGRPVAVERVRESNEARRCHVLFLSSSLRGKTAAALNDLRGASILTVGEVPDFTRYGGIIRMLLVENRVRFEINVDAAERAHLKISAKLLALSRVVHDERGKAAP